MAKKKRKKKDGKEPKAPAALAAAAPSAEEGQPLLSGDALALGSWLKLVRAAESLKANLAAGLAPHRLTLGQFGVLEALLHCGPLCQRDLAEKLQVSGGNMTTVIDNLERRALARRQRSARDRRYVSVHLTEEGEALIRRVYPEQAQRIVELMSHLSAKRLDRLGRLCRELGLQAASASRRGRDANNSK